MKQKFLVTGMTCSACSAHIEKSLSKAEGHPFGECEPAG